MTSPSSPLGRGLESLIPPSDDGQNNNSAAPAPVSIPVEPQTAPDPEQVSFDESAAMPEQPAQTPPPAAPVMPTAVSDISVPAHEHRAHNVRKYHDIDAVFQIEVEKIKPNPDQPRRHFEEDALRDLANSIREFGILQPLVVSKIQKDTEEGSDVEYQLIAGERRLMAAKLAGLPRVPAVVRQVGQKREQLEMAIIENLQREDLTPIETARAFARLQDEFALTQREIATRLGKSREVVANTVRLLNLPTFIQEALEQNKINESQARLLLAVTDLPSQERLFNELLRNNLSVRELKSRIKAVDGVSKTEKTAEDLPETDPEVREVKEQLEVFFGAPVQVESHGATGKIVISFYSPEELKNIVSRLEPKPALPEHEEGKSDEFIV